MKPPRSILFATGLLASCTIGSSATIVTYLDNTFTVNAAGNRFSVAASSMDSGVSASAIINQVANSTNANFSTGQYDAYAKTSYLPSSGTNASATPWLDFNVTVTDASTLDLTSITFSYGYFLSSGSVSSFTPSYTVHYSTDNFASSDVQVGSGGTTFTSLALNTRNISGAADVDLSSISGLATGQTIYFRIRLSSNVNNANLTYRVDNVALNGVFAAIPEPSAYAIVTGALALGLVLVRRRA